MKTINIALSLLAMSAVVASCSDSCEEFQVEDPQSEITASFQISGPAETGTRAAAEANDFSYTLEWTVFDVTDSENPKIFSSGSKHIGSLSANQTVDLQLIKEMQYKITFCAYDSTHLSFARYDNGKVRVDYAAADSIQIGEDLFTGFSVTFKATRDKHKERVVLHRPFAQLNWGCSELDEITVAPYLKGTMASVTVESGLYQTFDVLTGVYSDPIDGAFTFRKFDCSDLKDVDHGIPMYAGENRLLASNLLLVGDSSVDINCKMTFSGNVEAVAMVVNAPMEKNFRTNIFGSLITDPANLSLSINEFFIGDKTATDF